MNLETRVLWIIAGKEIRDALRNRWFLLVALIFSGLSLAFSFLGLSGLGRLGVSGFGRTTLSLLNLVLLIVPLMGLLLGSISLAAEREHGTLRSLLAQPVTAVEIFLGKFFGMAAALCSTILLGFGLSGIVIGFYGGTAHLGHYLVLLSYTVLLGLVYLGLGFLISTFSARTATAIGAAVFCWFLFLFLTDLGMMGTAIILKLEPRDFLWVALMNPAQSFKMAVIGWIQGDLDILGATGRYAAERLGEKFPVLLTGWMAAWAFLPIGGALCHFQKRLGQ